MLRLTVSTEEYLMIGENIKLVFLGGSGSHMRIMIDAPRDVHILRSTVMEKDLQAEGRTEELPRYYAEKEHPEKWKLPPEKKARIIIAGKQKQPKLPRENKKA